MEFFAMLYYHFHHDIHSLYRNNHKRPPNVYISHLAALVCVNFPLVKK
jgi:hypothetical protein